MARKIQIVLEDDLDGSLATETITFGLDGVTYEIDLSDANAARLREAMAVYVGVARKAGRGEKTARPDSGARTRKPSGAAAAGVDPAAVRAWANSRGLKTNPRGRISADLIKAFREAGN